MKKFGDLTRDEKVALFAAWVDGEGIEHFHPDSWWHLVKHPSWKNNAVYRVAERKPQIDWSHVAPEYNWLAMNGDGFSWLYRGEPSRIQDGWSDVYGMTEADVCGMTEANVFQSFKPGNCDWKDSLISRE